MATTTTTKSKSERQNLSRSKSFGTHRSDRRAISSSSSSERNSIADGPDHQKPGKSVPNYLKPTISSRPDPGKFLRRNNNNAGLEDAQKLLRRRSFDRPPSSLSSPPPSSSPRLQKSLNISPARPRDTHRPSVPREKPATAPRSASFHSNRGSARGAGTAKSPPVASTGSAGANKSGLSTSSSGSKKEASCANVTKKAAEKDIDGQLAPAPIQEEEQEIVRVATPATETHVTSEDKVALKSGDKVNEVQAGEAVQPSESVEEKKESDETDMSPALDSPDVTKAEEEEEEEEEEEQEEEEAVTNEDKQCDTEESRTEEQKENDADEAKEDEKAPENNQDKKTEVEDISTVIITDLKVETSSKESSTADEEKEKEKEERKTVTAESAEGTKRQVVQGKKESPSAYNDVIEKTASKLLENRKNKVKALVGAFETVIDYETAASK